MGYETLIQSALETIITTIFGASERVISVHRVTDDSFTVYITSSDSNFIRTLIGPVRFEKCKRCSTDMEMRGETINSIKRLFRIWANRNKIKVDVWVERSPIKKYD